MSWQDDRCGYFLWLQERLYPDDLEAQDQVLWAVYADGLGLTGVPARDMAAIRNYMINLTALRRSSATQSKDTSDAHILLKKSNTSG